MNVYFYTFGCKVNQYETENIKQNFLNHGFKTTNEIKDADIFIINTCTVTNMSDRKNRQLIHRIKKLKPSSIIVLTGCFPQAFKEQASQLHEVDIITGASDKTIILNLVEQFLVNHTRIIQVSEHHKGEKFESMHNNKFTEKTRAYIKIQDGCDQYCTYCIIPYARGHIRSKTLEDLKSELNDLALAGHKEIVLVGINLSCYGKEYGYRLIDAIEAACNTNGIERVRLGSLEPELISDDDIKRMALQKKLCPQFHLSLQSGCDKTLKAMNRKYNSEEYYTLVQKIRNAFKKCAITTDIMVGFPDETDEDFNSSLEFVKKVGFAKSHIFPYSIREGTVAAKMKNQITHQEKEKRAKLMAEITDRSHKAYLLSYVGKTVEVLVETQDDDGYYKGHTDDYIPVKFKVKNLNKKLKSSLTCVKIERLDNACCIGTVQD